MQHICKMTAVIFSSHWCWHALHLHFEISLLTRHCSHIAHMRHQEFPMM